MENTNILMVMIESLIIIVSFILGGYILPKYKISIQDAFTEFETVLKYAESYVAYAKQFLDIPDSEKMDVVVEKLKIICEQRNINIDEETLRAIGQKAYNNMKVSEMPELTVETFVEEVDSFNEEPVSETLNVDTKNKKTDANVVLL